MEVACFYNVRGMSIHCLFSPFQQSGGNGRRAHQWPPCTVRRTNEKIHMTHLYLHSMPIQKRATSKVKDRWKHKWWFPVVVLFSPVGTGESGKTTFIRQMRIIHGRGFSEDERKAFAKCIFQNIFTAVKAMTGAMTMLKIPYANPENQVNWHIPCKGLCQQKNEDATRYTWMGADTQRCQHRSAANISDLWAVVQEKPRGSGSTWTHHEPCLSFRCTPSCCRMWTQCRSHGWSGGTSTPSAASGETQGYGSVTAAAASTSSWTPRSSEYLYLTERQRCATPWELDAAVSENTFNRLHFIESRPPMPPNTADGFYWFPHRIETWPCKLQSFGFWQIFKQVVKNSGFTRAHMTAERRGITPNVCGRREFQTIRQDNF